MARPLVGGDRSTLRSARGAVGWGRAGYRAARGLRGPRGRRAGARRRVAAAARQEPGQAARARARAPPAPRAGGRGAVAGGGDPAGNSLHQVLYTARRALGRRGRALRLALRDDVVALAGDGARGSTSTRSSRPRRRPAPSGTIRSAYRAALELYSGRAAARGPLRGLDRRRGARRCARPTWRCCVELAELQAGRATPPRRSRRSSAPWSRTRCTRSAHRALMRLFAEDGRRQQALAQYQQLRAGAAPRAAADPDPETPRPLPARSSRARTATATRPPAGAARRRRRPCPTQLDQLRRPRARAGRARAGCSAHTRLLTLTGPGGCGQDAPGARAGRSQAGRLRRRRAPRRARAGRRPGARGRRRPRPRSACSCAPTATRSRPSPSTIGDRAAAARARQLRAPDRRLRAARRRLLRACPELHVLATSRERLRDRRRGRMARAVAVAARGRRRRRAELERSEAVRLFCQRAADAAPGFALTDENAAAVAEICRRLDGMPLALELAAARAGGAVAGPDRRAPRRRARRCCGGGSRAGLTRQQTLRATLDWSHDLLAEPERVLYRRLGVFAGGFGVEAVEGICGGDEVADRRGAGRCSCASWTSRSCRSSRHATAIATGCWRPSARTRASGWPRPARRDALEAAHRAWYLALAEAADRDADPARRLRMAGRPSGARVTTTCARRWPRRSARDPRRALRLAGALWWWCMARGSFVEGSPQLEAALAAAPEPTPRARAGARGAGALEVRRTARCQ